MGQTLSIFDRVTIGTILGAGVLQAAQQGLKDADHIRAAVPMLDLSGGWNYVPLALLVVGGLSWVAKQVVARRPEKVNFPEIPPAPISTRRDFLPAEMTVARLGQLGAGMTGAQVKRILAPYAGKWMRFSGTVHDVKFVNDETAVLFLLGPGDTSFLKTSVPPLVFDRKLWEHELHELKIGQAVTAEGKIAIAGSDTIMMEACELTQSTSSTSS